MLALAGAVVLVSGPQARPASAAVGSCPAPGDMPNVGQTPPLFTDTNVTVWTGGDYHATASAAESEGLLVVAGETTIDGPGNFSIGAVGAGSQITPPDGAVMLAVGGGLEIRPETSVTVGSTLPTGGAVNVGAAVTGGGSLSTAGTTPGADAPVTQGMGAAALGEWAGYGAVVAGGVGDDRRVAGDRGGRRRGEPGHLHRRRHRRPAGVLRRRRAARGRQGDRLRERAGRRRDRDQRDR
nr:choice-of-anchor A family protein [Cellulosimicrobium sp. MM]